MLPERCFRHPPADAVPVRYHNVYDAPTHPATMRRHITLWRWGESNPRPRATFQGFSGRSRWGDLASRLPPAEDLSASPGSMSGGGPRAEPLP
jgi:hypothetical protein